MCKEQTTGDKRKVIDSSSRFRETWCIQRLLAAVASMSEAKRRILIRSLLGDNFGGKEQLTPQSQPVSITIENSGTLNIFCQYPHPTTPDEV
jgi:hypothetical protein